MKVNDKIKARIKSLRGPCHCGCQGQDSWHKRSFVRLVTVTAAGLYEPRTECGPWDFFISARGTAKFPWGNEEVIHISLKDREEGRSTDLGWERLTYFES